jgi:hypothetical protein
MEMFSSSDNSEGGRMFASTIFRGDEPCFIRSACAAPEVPDGRRPGFHVMALIGLQTGHLGLIDLLKSFVTSAEATVPEEESIELPAAPQIGRDAEPEDAGGAELCFPALSCVDRSIAANFCHRAVCRP